ncbi:ATP-binding protein [Sorangium sp. So ce296]|uniref:AAA family ATPase n=1 Tax=Sorangium sp. So ce296 TaxID=3133296 RepID=UPI003F5F66A3
MPPGTGILSLRGDLPASTPWEAEQVRKALDGIRLIQAGLPRYRGVRRELFLTKMRPRPGAERDESGQSDHRLNRVSASLVSWYENRPELFQQFLDIARRLEVLRDLAVKIEEHSELEGDSGATASAELLVDGVNCGLLSDGVLRVAEILVSIVDPKSKFVMIEEPETGIHPGLLRRLLAEIDAHAVDRQFVVSTHSPLVVDWVAPSDVRFVERTNGVTSVQRLSDEEISRVVRYLNESLSLSDYVYSRGLE